MNKKEFKSFEEYKKAFDEIYLDFYTKNDVIIILAIIVAVVLALCLTFFVFKGSIVLFTIISFLFVLIFFIILLEIDNCKLKKQIEEFKYSNIDKDKEIKELKKYERVKKFNKKLELYCKEKLVSDYKISKETFKMFFIELTTRLGNLKTEKHIWIVKYLILPIVKLFKSKIFLMIISSIIGFFGKQLYISNNLIDIIILFFLISMLIITIIYIFLDSKNKNINIEIGRKYILSDILIEIFISSAINESIWITEDVEIQLREGEKFLFVNREQEKIVSVIEKDGKFSLIEDNQQINSKYIRLKRIEKQNINSDN